MLRLVLLLGIAWATTGCLHPHDSQLAEVRERGTLRVAMGKSAAALPVGQPSTMGAEHELAALFAEALGVELSIVVPDRSSDILALVTEGEADLAAGGLIVNARRARRVRFGPPYETVTPQLVYRRGSKRPKGLADLLDGDLEIVAGSAHGERLLHLRHNGHPRLRWRANEGAGSIELLQLVDAGLIDFTIAGSTDVALTRRFHPELRVAFEVAGPQHLAWAFARDRDDSLYGRAHRFFAEITAEGRLAQILHRHYGHVEPFDYLEVRVFNAHIRTRLPRYRTAFEAAAAATGLEWPLLAAMGYQESRWDPAARSPTGVRGLMMLTLNTARQLGIDDRTDPTQSIVGGARYFAHLRKRLGEEIPEPDRTWFALASYNVGLGHLEDARILAKTSGRDPDKWVHVREFLPLLSRKAWYRKTRYGYARGHEPVAYVKRVRRYRDLLLWHLDHCRERPPSPPIRPNGLQIASPAL
jgi:membrane-bound lytic murein transglycosylase F